MDDKKELLNFLEEDMKEQSGLIIDQINYEIKAMEEKQIQIFKEGLKKEIESYKERELNDLKKQSATLSSQNKLKIQRELLLQREELVLNLFDEAKSKIQSFTQSKEYPLFLKKHIQEITIPGGIFYVRKEDLNLMKEILKETGLEGTVEEAVISLGGFRYVHKQQRIEMDNTLDTAVQNQKVWFENHSGLIV